MIEEKLQSYLDGLIPDRSEIFHELETYAKEHSVPIMELQGIEALLQLLRMQNPSSILEVGTAIGYSALRMADALPKAVIVTIERDAERYTVAEKYIEKSGKSKQVVLIKGDALVVEEDVQKYAPYDVIFIDAAKGQYQRFFEMYSQYLNDGGVIITDNVLFKGLVSEPEIESKRIRSLVKKINAFNHWLMSHPEFHTVILPVGDGVAISKKR